jgi:hypothetical protein
LQSISFDLKLSRWHLADLFTRHLKTRRQVYGCTDDVTLSILKTHELHPTRSKAKLRRLFGVNVSV